MVDRQDIHCLFTPNAMQLTYCTKGTTPLRHKRPIDKSFLARISQGPEKEHHFVPLFEQPNMLWPRPVRSNRFSKIIKRSTEQSSDASQGPQLVIKRLQPKLGLSQLVTKTSMLKGLMVTDPYKLSEQKLKQSQPVRYRVRSEKKPDVKLSPFQLYMLFAHTAASCLRIRPVGQASVKAYVGYGNNHMLVRSVLRTRGWIFVTDNRREANFVWTQTIKKMSAQAVPSLDYRKMRVPAGGRCSQRFRGQDLSRFFPDDFSDSREYSFNQLNRVLLNTDTSQVDIFNLMLHNHIEGHQQLSDKKNLMHNLVAHYSKEGKDPFTFIPKTYHINSVEESAVVLEEIGQDKKSVWVVKPGESSNRGNGIQVFDKPSLIQTFIQTTGKESRTFVVQKYIMPMLYRKRKFDIRAYMLLTCVAGYISAFWFDEGYGRTSSKQFVFGCWADTQMHLTNDAVQKKYEDYGRHQSYNKISYQDISKLVESNGGSWQQVKGKMKDLARDAVAACYSRLVEQRGVASFQLMGLDFLIDRGMNPWLIQVNTNPCLQLSGSLLSRVIPTMIQATLRLTLDPLFLQDTSKRWQVTQDSFGFNKFSLIFQKKLAGFEY